MVDERVNITACNFLWIAIISQGIRRKTWTGDLIVNGYHKCVPRSIGILEMGENIKRKITKIDEVIHEGNLGALENGLYPVW
jgi:hypothetical protein